MSVSFMDGNDWILYVWLLNKVRELLYNKCMKRRDVTGYPLSPNQRKEVEEYMSNHNVTENEARYMLGYVPGDLPQVSVTEALEMVKEENPNVELTKETLKFYLDEVMKKCAPKPNPKFAIEILRANLIK